MITDTAEIKSLKSEYQGLSTDIKPTNCRSGSTFYEIDTKLGYVYDKGNINPATSNHWWGV